MNTAHRPPNLDPDVYRALSRYAGESSFLRSLAVRVRAGHGLTVRQLDAARRVLELPADLAPPARRLSTTQEAAAAGPKYPRPPVPRGPRRLPA